MAWTTLNANTITENNTDGSTTFALTIDGSADIVVIWAMWTTLGTAPVSADVSGSAATLIDERSGGRRVAVWYITAPPVGAQNVNITFSAAAGRVVCGAFDLLGGALTQTPAFVDGLANDGNSLLTVTAGSGDIVIDVVGWAHTAGEVVTLGPDQTELGNLTGGASRGVVSMQLGSAGGVMTQSSSNPAKSWTGIAFTLAPAAGGSVFTANVSRTLSPASQFRAASARATASGLAVSAAVRPITMKPLVATIDPAAAFRQLIDINVSKFLFGFPILMENGDELLAENGVDGLGTETGSREGTISPVAVINFTTDTSMNLTASAAVTASARSQRQYRKLATLTSTAVAKKTYTKRFIAVAASVGVARKTAMRRMSAQQASVGVARKLTGRRKTAIEAPASSVVKVPIHRLVAIEAPQVTINVTTDKTLTATTSSEGVVYRHVSRSFTRTQLIAAVAIKFSSRKLLGSMSLSASVQKQVLSIKAAVVASIATVDRVQDFVFGATIAAASSVQKLIIKFPLVYEFEFSDENGNPIIQEASGSVMHAAGAISTSGERIITLSAAEAPVAAIRRSTSRGIVASVQAAGSYTVAINRKIGSSVASSSSIILDRGQHIIASVNVIGVAIKSTTRTFARSITSGADVQIGSRDINFSASVGTTGDVARSVERKLVADVEPVADVEATGVIRLAVSRAMSMMGTVQASAARRIERTLSAAAAVEVGTANGLHVGGQMSPTATANVQSSRLVGSAVGGFTSLSRRVFKKLASTLYVLVIDKETGTLLPPSVYSVEVVLHEATLAEETLVREY